jgi:hypothetical protein
LLAAAKDGTTVQDVPTKPSRVPLDSYLPAAHAVHVVFAALTIEPPPQLVHAVTVPVLEYVPAPHAIFAVAPPDAGHLEPPGHGEHVALVATPAAS